MVFRILAPSAVVCANPDATEGSIAPGGGCPFNFFTSRKWSYTEAGLTLRDHNAQALVSRF